MRSNGFAKSGGKTFPLSFPREAIAIAMLIMSMISSQPVRAFSSSTTRVPFQYSANRRFQVQRIQVSTVTVGEFTVHPSEFAQSKNIKKQLLDESDVAGELVGAVPSVTTSNIQSISGTKTHNSILSLALAGALALAIGDGTMYPLDTIKTLQQSDAGYGLSMWQAANMLFDQSGWAGFYGGYFTCASFDAMGGSFKFVTYELGKQFCMGCNSNETKENQQFMFLFACAALAFVASSVVVVPGELLKQQLQMHIYDGLPQALQGIIERDGFGGLYKGYEGVMFRGIPFTMLELGLYDLLKNAITQSKERKLQKGTLSKERPASQSPVSVSAVEGISVAAIAGGFAGYLTAPIDTIKTKVMIDQQQLYDGGFFDCLLSTLDEHGVASLFAGGLARALWLGSFTAMYLPVYEFFKCKFSVADTTTNAGA